MSNPLSPYYLQGSSKESSESFVETMPVPIPGPAPLPLLGNIGDVDAQDGIGSLSHLSDIYGIFHRHPYIKHSSIPASDISSQVKYSSSVSGEGRKSSYLAVPCSTKFATRSALRRPCQDLWNRYGTASKTGCLQHIQVSITGRSRTEH